MNTIGNAAKVHTTTQLPVVNRYISLGRSWPVSGRPRTINRRPQTKVIKLDQRKADRSSLRSKATSVIIGIAMLTASVIRKMPKMKPISRIAARDITVACQFSAAQYRMLNLNAP
ncbi:hypothetical protein D3C78_1067340 [compost metagenome]